MERTDALRDFLRSRRARLRPADVGLPEGVTRRRVPGLRREEVAMLAGVSVDYYVHLEQGRARQVSAPVVDAVAGALRLDPSETAYLHDLVSRTGSVPRHARSTRSSGSHQQELVRPAIRELLDALDHVPAYLVGRRTDVLAYNSLAAVLFRDFGAPTTGERNMARMVFLDPGARDLYEDWEQKAHDVVAYLRLDAGRHPDDPHLAALVGELSMTSQAFARLWASQDVRDKTHGTIRAHHPHVGSLVLNWETLRSPDSDHALIAHYAPSGSAAATALRLLEPLAAEHERAPTTNQPDDQRPPRPATGPDQTRDTPPTDPPS